LYYQIFSFRFTMWASYISKPSTRARCSIIQTLLQ